MAHNNDKTLSIIEQVFKTMPQLLDERQRRLLAASIAKGYGHGGIKLVSEASGMDIRTIRSGIHEIQFHVLKCVFLIFRNFQFSHHIPGPSVGISHFSRFLVIS